jgi:transposase
MPSSYPPELRRQVVELARSGTRVAVLDTFGMSAVSIYNWLKRDRIDRGEEIGRTTDQQLDLAAAKRRITQLETELASPGDCRAQIRSRHQRRLSRGRVDHARARDTRDADPSAAQRRASGESDLARSRPSRVSLVIARALCGLPTSPRIRLDADEDRVQCHLCGGWFRSIGGAPLHRIHGWTLDEYRDAFQLPRQMPTCAESVSSRQSQTRVRADQRRTLRAGRRHSPHLRGRTVRPWRTLAAQRPDLLAELHPTRNTARDPATMATRSNQKV